MEHLELSGVTFNYDRSGFGVNHAALEVTSYAIQQALKALIGLCSKDTWQDFPASPFEEYTDLLWTPWSIVSTRSTPNALSERLRLRSVPIWDANQWSNYALLGSYRDCWDSVCAPMTSKIGLLRRIYTEFDGLRLLDIGCGSGASLLRFLHHGFDAYGLEIDPCLVSHVPPLLRSHVVWGDALYSLYAFKHDFFDVTFVSCLGYIMSSDIERFLTDAWLVLKMGSPLVLDLPTNSREVTVEDKIRYGPYVRASQTYHNVLYRSGYTYVDTVNGLLIATKTHTPETF